MAALNEDLERRLAARPGEAASGQLVALHEEVGHPPPTLGALCQS